MTYVEWLRDQLDDIDREENALAHRRFVLGRQRILLGKELAEACDHKPLDKAGKPIKLAKMINCNYRDSKQQCYRCSKCQLHIHQ